MAWAALAAVAVGSAMQLGGALTQSDALKQAGAQQRIEKNFEAQQMEQNATQTVASSQRQAMAERRQAQLVASRALALGGSSGAGLTDPTMAGILTDIASEGSYRSALALYEGEDRARKMRMGAEAAEYEGEVLERGAHQKAKAVRTTGYGSVMQGLGSMGMKYGMGSGTGGSGGTSLSSGTGFVDAGTPSYANYG